MNDLTALAQIPPLLGAGGYSELAGGLVISIGAGLLIVTGIAAVLGLMVRSRIIALCSVILVTFLGLNSVTSWPKQNNSLDYKRRHFDELIRVHAATWALGFIVLVPLVMAAVYRADAKREATAVMLGLLVSVLLLITYPLALVVLTLLAPILWLLSERLPD
jgi:hypothetical protein